MRSANALKWRQSTAPARPRREKWRKQISYYLRRGVNHGSPKASTESAKPLGGDYDNDGFVDRFTANRGVAMRYESAPESKPLATPEPPALSFGLPATPPLAAAATPPPEVSAKAGQALSDNYRLGWDRKAGGPEALAAAPWVVLCRLNPHRPRRLPEMPRMGHCGFQPPLRSLGSARPRRTGYWRSRQLWPLSHPCLRQTIFRNFERDTLLLPQLRQQKSRLSPEVEAVDP